MAEEGWSLEGVGVGARRKREGDTLERSGEGKRGAEGGEEPRGKRRREGLNLQRGGGRGEA